MARQPPLGMPASMSECRFQSQRLCSVRFRSRPVGLESQRLMAQVLGLLPSTWETWEELPALAWPSPGCRSHLLEDLFFFFFPVTLPFK